MPEAHTIIPEANHALRMDLFAFVQEKQTHLAPRIMEAIQGGEVVFFVGVCRAVGAPDEPPITAADIEVMHLPDGRPLNITLASTKLTPHNISPIIQERGHFLRQLPAKVFLELCAERGIIAIALDSGLEGAVLLGHVSSEPWKVVPQPLKV